MSIYKLYSPHMQEIYIGSTTQTLKQRLKSHKDHFEAWKRGTGAWISSFWILEQGDVKIAALEKHPGAHRDFLWEREEFWVENALCVNAIVPRCKKTRKQAKKAQMAVISKKHKHKYAVEEICKCGGRYQKTNKARHIMTQRHQLWLIE